MTGIIFSRRVTAFWKIAYLKMEHSGAKGIKNSLENFLQTFYIGLWMFLFLHGGPMFIILFLYILFYTRFWLVPVLYLIWMYIDKETPSRGGRKWRFMRTDFIWKYYRSYFPARLIGTANLDQNKNYMFICHPHGILSMSFISNFSSDNPDLVKLYKNFTIFEGTLNLNFHFPIVRELLLATGTVSVAKESLLHVLNSKNKGNIFVLIVGGAAESLLSKPNVYRLVLKNRMGFVKVALESGSSLVPVLSFGEVDIFDQIDAPPSSRIYKIQRWLLKATGVGLCLYYGRGFLKRLPFKKDLTTIVGEPIDVPKITNPTEEEVKHYHNLYITKLQDLFNENREKYIKSSEKVELIIE